MSDIGKSELFTQKRVIALFRDELDYHYLGDWCDRDGNSNIVRHASVPSWKWTDTRNVGTNRLYARCPIGRNHAARRFPHLFNVHGARGPALFK